MNLEKQNELILVFEEKLMFGFQGLLPKDYPLNNGWDNIGGISKLDKDLSWLRKCEEMAYFLPRGLAEENPAYKQLIPYIILRCEGLYFVYKRQGTETRLSGNYSIGIGGHVNPCDYTSSFNSTLRNAAKREFFEELEIPNMDRSTLIQIKAGLALPQAVLYAGNLPGMVNQVHVGVLHTVILNKDVALKVNLIDEGKQVDWMTKDQLLALGDQLETWSRLAINLVPRLGLD